MTDFPWIGLVTFSVGVLILAWCLREWVQIKQPMYRTPAEPRRAASTPFSATGEVYHSSVPNGGDSGASKFASPRPVSLRRRQELNAVVQIGSERRR